ncbi:MAG: nitrilase-related carbon-nitrogen hydrolase [Candidatus Hodarchaeales archaeon]
MKPFRLSLVQIDISFGNKQGNFRSLENILEQKSSKEKTNENHLVCLPELFSSSFDLSNVSKLAEEIPTGETTKFLQNLALEHNIAITASFIEREDKLYYNSAVVIDKSGKYLGKYRKTMLFPLDPLDETKTFQPGIFESHIFELDFVKLGVLICYDLRFPELSRKLTFSGAEVIVYLAEFPRPRDYVWKNLLQARAIENELYVAGVNRTGRIKGAEFFGSSMIINPLGQVLAEAEDEIRIISADLDPEVLEQTRKTLPLIPFEKEL